MSAKYRMPDEEGDPLVSYLDEPAVAYRTLADDFSAMAARMLRSLPALEAVRILTATAQKQLHERPAPEARMALAEMRGLQAREEMKHEEGGSLSAEEAGAMLGISKAAVLKRYHKGQVMAWREARQSSVRFPVWQFANGDVLPGLAEVLSIFQQAPWTDDWTRIGFFLNPLESLGRKRPLDLLRQGETQRVAWAAQASLE